MTAAQPPAKPVTLGDLFADYRQQAHLHDQGAGERPDWVDVIIHPLARELGALTGLQAQVGGPMGLGAHVMVSLKTPEDKTVHYLTFRPHQDEASMLVRLVNPYSDTEEYAPGTAGHRSSLHLGAVELPPTFTARDVLELNASFVPSVQAESSVREA